MSKREYGLFAMGQMTLHEPLTPLAPARSDSPPAADGLAHRFIPGQWEAAYDHHGGDLPAPAFFTNVITFPAPLAALKDIVCNAAIATYHFFTHTREQHIRADSVLRPDGARKKRFVDVGFRDKPTETPQIGMPEPQPLDLPFDLPAFLPATPNFAADAPLGANLHSPEFFDGTELHGTPTLAPSTPTSPSPRIERANASPLNKHPRLPFNRVSRFGKPVPKRLEQLTNPHQNHTKLTQKPVKPLPRISKPYTAIGVQHSLKTTKTIKPTKPSKTQAQKVNGLFQVKLAAEHSEGPVDTDARAAWRASYLQEPPTLETEELSFLSDAPDAPDVTAADVQDVAAPDEIPALKITDPHGTAFEARSNNIPYTGPYKNDAWFLPDAPTPSPRKTTESAPDAHVRHFYKDSGLCDTLDSTLESIASIPLKELHDVVGDGSFISIEVLNEYKCNAKPPAPQQQSQAPTVQAPVGQAKKPLLRRLKRDDLKHIIEATKKTEAGLLNTDIVEGRINTHDLRTLLPGEFHGDPKAWLNDNIVNEFLALVVEQAKKKAGYKHRPNGPAPPIHAFASQWYQSVNKNVDLVARWAKKKQMGGENLLDVNLLLIPVCHGGHWRLVAIKPRDRTVEYLDSMTQDGDAILKKTREYLQHELGKFWVEKEWTFIYGRGKEQRSEQQQNASDCGVFTCLNALALIRGEEPSIVRPDDGMELARRHIAVSLISRKLTVDV